MEGSQKSRRTEYPDHYIKEHQHHAYPLQEYPEWILSRGGPFQDRSPSVWMDSFVYTHLPYSYHFFMWSSNKEWEALKLETRIR